MKLAVFGASGRTGRLLVQQAIVMKHSVNALVRDPSKLSVHDAALHVVQGDARDPVAAEMAVAGSDAVVSVIGHAKGSGSEVQTIAMRNILIAMAKCSIRRIVILTGTGVRFPGDLPGITDRLLNAILGIVDPERLADGRNHAALLQASDTDWTIVRALLLGNGKKTGVYRIREKNVATGMTISRADVADFILKLACGNDFVRKAPVISY